MLDANVAANKTKMSVMSQYPCGMDDTRKLVAAATARLIGPGKQFKSARELAQRAFTHGYVENVESFARLVARVIKAENDSQISTAAGDLCKEAGFTIIDRSDEDASLTSSPA